MVEHNRTFVVCCLLIAMLVLIRLLSSKKALSGLQKRIFIPKSIFSQISEPTEVCKRKKKYDIRYTFEYFYLTDWNRKHGSTTGFHCSFFIGQCILHFQNCLIYVHWYAYSFECVLYIICVFHR